MIDLNRGRRTEKIRCEYWSVDDNELITSDQICYKKDPSGLFFCKEVNAYEDSNQIVGDSFMTSQSNVTIFTRDDITNVDKPLKENDIVKYLGKIYRVASIQREPIKKQNEFMQIVSYNSYIRLRG